VDALHWQRRRLSAHFACVPVPCSMVAGRCRRRRHAAPCAAGPWRRWDPCGLQKAEAKRWVAVSAKRRGGDSAGRSRRPLLVSVDPYGSDLWRLDPVIQLLRDGAVWPQQPSSCTAASSSLNVYACTLLLTCWTCAAQLGIIPTDR